ncbi:hypothetical protein FACS189425_01960 [Clostridia bacterium]|nr:hypothetical protein FACS189425_01960 [Clostridia bacterium]
MAIVIPVLIVLEIIVYIVLAQLHAPAPAPSDDFLLDEQGNAIVVNDADRKKDFFTLLIVGKDAVAMNTDTIMVASVDVANKTYNVLSIPRDTMSNTSRAVKKINAAYGYGGVDTLKREVSDLVGFKLDKYVIIKLEGFEKVIDTIGGVEVDVPQKMDYDDPEQNLHIHLKPGPQTLMGKDAVGFVRFRSGYPDADLGRIRAQQMFVSSVIAKLTAPSSFFKVVPIAKAVFENIQTDLTSGEIIWAATNMRDIGSEQVTMATIPGRAAPYGGLSYYFVNQKETLELVNAKFNPYTRQIYSLNLGGIKAGDQPPVKATPTPVPETTPVATSEPEASSTPTPTVTITPTATPTITSTPDE